MNKKRFSLLLAVILLLSVLSGCGSSTSSIVSENADSAASISSVPSTETAKSAEEPQQAEDELTPTEDAEPDEEQSDVEDTAAEEVPEGAPEGEAFSYPLPLFEEEKTFSMWKSLNGDLYSTCMPNGYLDNYAYQKSVELTNVSIDYITPTSAAAVEQYGIMIASGEYPDMIANLASMSNDSFDSLIEQDILIDLYPYVQENMPVYKALLDERGDTLYLEILTDAGQMGATYSVQRKGDDPIYGLAIRQDWLDELGLEIPETYQELTEVATAFKNEKGATEPIHYLGMYDFCEGYGVLGYNVNFNPFAKAYQGFYQVDGQVKFGLIEEGYRDYLEMVAQWYADGLINPEFYTYNQNRNGSEAEAARVGDYCGVIGIDPNNLDYYEANAETPGYSLSAMAYPTVNPGETIHLAEYSNLTTPVISVTTDCEDVESVVTWLDWWYTDQGSDLANYGVEGLTMEYDENGEPYYTELYTQNDGSIISDDEFPQLYFFQVVSNVRIPTGVKSFYSEKAQSFPDVWTANQDTAWAMPPIALNEAEGELFSATFSDISTYFAQCLPQFAIGEKPVSEWDEFADTIQSMGIQDCIDCWQAALDRYNGKINVS